MPTDVPKVQNAKIPGIGFTQVSDFHVRKVTMHDARPTSSDARLYSLGHMTDEFELAIIK